MLYIGAFDYSIKLVFLIFLNIISVFVTDNNFIFSTVSKSRNSESSIQRNKAVSPREYSIAVF